MNNFFANFFVSSLYFFVISKCLCSLAVLLRCNGRGLVTTHAVETRDVKGERKSATEFSVLLGLITRIPPEAHHHQRTHPPEKTS